MSAHTILTIWAAAAAAVACSALLLRSSLMDPHIHCFPTAPRFVQLAVAMVGAIMGGVAICIWRVDHVTLREATVYSAVAGGSVIVLCDALKSRTSAAG